MKTAFVATVTMLIDADSEAAACDGVTALLTENMKKYSDNPEWTCLIDWHYYNYQAPEETQIPDDYEGH